MIGAGLGCPAVSIAGAVMVVAGLAIVLASRKDHAAPPIPAGVACGQEA